MAVDQALLLGAEDDPASSPVLRFYSWARPTLSIGRLQKTDGLNLGFLDAEAIPIVRRPTGGRALLHHQEVTYSVTLPEQCALYGSLEQVYGRVTAALALALGMLGVEADGHDGAGQSEAYSFSDACFATRLGHEISVHGWKVAAGAQRRLRRSAMQHGSILLAVDGERSLDCVVWPDPQKRRLAAGAMAGLWDLAGEKIGADRVADNVIEAFGRLHGVEFEPSRLSSGEEARARIIIGKERETPRMSTAI